MLLQAARILLAVSFSVVGASSKRMLVVALSESALFILYLRFRELTRINALQVGVLDIDPADVTMKGRLGPGMMILADLETGEVSAARQELHQTGF